MDSTRALPEKGPDGKFHVEGRLEIATRDEAKRMVTRLYRCSEPAFSAEKLFSHLAPDTGTTLAA